MLCVWSVQPRDGHLVSMSDSTQRLQGTSEFVRSVRLRDGNSSVCLTDSKGLVSLFDGFSSRTGTAQRV